MSLLILTGGVRNVNICKETARNVAADVLNRKVGRRSPTIVIRVLRE